MKPYYQVMTFGCQMNEHDSEIIAGMMETMGYLPSDDLSQCDIIILNTCCVRETAENKILGVVGSLKKYKTANPNLIVAVGGCMPQQPGAVERIKKRAPFVDIIFGTHNMHNLPVLLDQALQGCSGQVEIYDSEGEVRENLPVKRQGKDKAQVTITYGCNNFCSYCIVPYVRGRERSRLPEEIIKEITVLGREGYQEVQLLGQNVNSYGLDFKEPYDFADLLREIDRIPGIARIRYMTSHPRDITDKLIDTIADCDKVCEHFHLPVQAGSNRILELMNRGYSREDYLELIRKIRHKFPEASITTDIIIGFPGETEQDFADTLDLIKRIRFDMAYSFLYSIRSGTPAAEMPDQVTKDIKQKRLQMLMDIQNEISLEINQKLVGTIQEVFIDGASKTNQHVLTGRTRTNKIVNFPGEIDHKGFVKVMITKAKTWHLEGKLVN